MVGHITTVSLCNETNFKNLQTAEVRLERPVARFSQFYLNETGKNDINFNLKAVKTKAFISIVDLS